MTTYTYAQLEGLWINAGGPSALAPLAAAIAMAESGGNSNALNLTDNGGTQTSVGLWQVSNGTHNYPAAWATAAGNAAEAVAKYQGAGNSFSPWGTYVSGAYKKFLNATTAAATSVAGSAAPPAAAGGASAWQTIWAGIVGGLDFSSSSGSEVAQALTGAGSAADATEQGLLALAAPFIKITEAIDWLFHPSSWIRIIAGVGGGIMVLGGAFQMFHTGGEIPVSAYGVSTSVGIPRAASLPLGILLTGIGGLLLFVAFHNLPGDVDSFPTFIGYLTDEISGGSKTAIGTSA